MSAELWLYIVCVVIVLPAIILLAACLFKSQRRRCTYELTGEHDENGAAYFRKVQKL